MSKVIDTIRVGLEGSAHSLKLRRGEPTVRRGERHKARKKGKHAIRHNSPLLVWRLEVDGATCVKEGCIKSLFVGTFLPSNMMHAACPAQSILRITPCSVILASTNTVIGGQPLSYFVASAELYMYSPP